MLVSKLQNLGALIAGKTNMNEMGYGTSGRNYYHNDMPNHKHSDYSAIEGGAALVSNESVDVAIGTDTLGVSRIAAASNQIVCYKPTINRYPNDYGFKMSQSMSTVTLQTRSMEDLIFIDDVIQGKNNEKVMNLSEIKLGIIQDYMQEDLDPVVNQKFNSFIKTLELNGVNFIRNDGICNLLTLLRASGTILQYEYFRGLQDYIDKNSLDKTIEQLIDKSQTAQTRHYLFKLKDNRMSELRYKQALFIQRAELIEKMQEYFMRNNLDAIIYPTMVCKPFKLKGIQEEFGYKINHNERQVSQLGISLRNTRLSSLANMPSISIPIKSGIQDIDFEKNVNFELASLTWNDRKLLRIGQALEKDINTTQ
ncbi:UNKNOWN [Stylonychia lemnae]|uniref:Amidase domain-containing protein n=1 Tax=Stylonychia lemnae TaxID=5949 RepID=A0A078AL84_STYLE|nr:UNKNOWN [Stylonychia lemnae]|eukprot:CDW82959.1 UNKNOWN [Stylonychia lemnae]